MSIDLTSMNEWQHRDPANGLVMPWYTRPALDEVIQWDLHNALILEVGGGASTLWWDHVSAGVFTVDSNPEYLKAIQAALPTDHNVELLTYSPAMLDFIAARCEKYGVFFDIAINDGPERDDCVAPLLASLRPGGKLIIDNWMQPEVYMPSPQTVEYLALYTKSMKVYPQAGHPNWTTAIFIKP